jgi:chromosome segregation ATPase
MTSDRDQALRGEIDRLVSEAQERNLILQNRNDELVRVKSELDSLSERFTQLEANAIQAESSASGDAERMRTEYQAQLALLQAELSQKEWALEERQAIIAGIEQEHRHEIDALRQQLAVKQFTAGPDEGAFVVGDLTDTRPEKSDKFDDMVKAIRNGNNHDHSMPPPRRWHSGFGWKRRWRS